MTRMIASLGYGAMAKSLAKSLAAGNSGFRLSGFYLPPDIQADAEPGLICWRDIEVLIAARPDLVVECATHAAVRETVPLLLENGLMW